MARKYRRSQPSFDPVLSRGIIAIVLVISAIIITLSFFDAAGPLGYILNEGVLSFLFGAIRYTTPFIILLIAWFFIKDIEYDYRATHGIGAALFFLSTCGLFHIGFDTSDMWAQTVLGNGGGIFGMTAWPLKTYLGTVAGVIIFFGLIVVSLLLMFNTLIVHFLSLNKKLVAELGSFGKNFLKIMTSLTVPGGNKDIDGDEEEYEDEEDYEDEEEDEDEEEEKEFTSKRVKSKDEEYEDEDETEEESEEDGAKRNDGVWKQKVIIKDLPPLHILSSKKDKPTSGDIDANKDIISETLVEFGIDVDMGNVQVGPTVTQYTLKPRKGIKISRITSLSNDLALALAAHPIRIEAPIPGKSLVGIEVPNQKTAMVTFKELLDSKEFKNRPHPNMIALGKDVAGKVWFGDLPRMPHLLIAGATGSGKTVCVNTILMSLLYQNTAETLRMIMVDPKRVELTMYNGIPHLLTPVITNTQKTVNALKWTIGEMERRFEIFAEAKSRNLNSYNAKHPNDKLPHIIFVIDELADLMATAAGDVESGIIRLAQMARATGIHLILATQRPSVDVITGLMKANIPARIAFSVASSIDSRTILDSPGAEKLLGRGDMLFSTADVSKPVRIQGAFISEDELRNVVDYLKGDEAPEYDESIVEKQSGSGTVNMFGGPADDQDSLYEDARAAILEAGKASASFLQRKLKVGYARAARILDELEAAGIIGPADGAKPREVLATEQEVIRPRSDSGGDLNVYDEEEGEGEEDDEGDAPEPEEETQTETEEDGIEEESDDEEDELESEDETEQDEDEEYDEDDSEEESDEN